MVGVAGVRAGPALGRHRLGVGPAAAAADRDLDAVVALFDAAGRFADRLPKACPAVFLDHLLGQQIPGDTLAPQAPTSDGVRLMTAHAAKGLEFDVVVVAGVQEGRVARPAHARVAARCRATRRPRSGSAEPTAPQSLNAQLGEERRLFYVAVTRARRLLVVTAVRAEDQQPSRFLDELAPVDTDERPLTRLSRGLDFPSVVAELRAVVTHDTDTDAVRRAPRPRSCAGWRLLASGGPTQPSGMASSRCRTTRRWRATTRRCGFRRPSWKASSAVGCAGCLSPQEGRPRIRRRKESAR